MAQAKRTYRLNEGALRGGSAVAALVVCLLAAGFFASAPAAAHAEEAYLEIQAAQEAMELAQTEVDEVNAKAKQLEARIAEIEAVLPAQQQRSDQALRNLYKMQEDRWAMLDVLLGSQSLDEFILQAEYLHRITTTNLDTINKTKELRAELEQSEQRIAAMREEAQSQLDVTTEALEALENERVERQREGIERAQSQVTASTADDFITVVEEADAEEDAESASSESPEGDGGEDARPSHSVATAIGPEQAASMHGEAAALINELDDGADWHMSEDEFVEEWAPRIDKYLAGSPMAGTGEHFARSAWKYCVDPRWSPAISNIESGKGSICIRPFNAWGWGAADSDPYNLALEWSSWEEAIDAHVKGLADGYGYTITLAGAHAYCPPNWQSWYITTVTQMGSI